MKRFLCFLTLTVSLNLSLYAPARATDPYDLDPEKYDVPESDMVTVHTMKSADKIYNQSKELLTSDASGNEDLKTMTSVSAEAQTAAFKDHINRSMGSVVNGIVGNQ